MDSRNIRAGGLFVVFVFLCFFEALARLYTPCMRVAFWPLFNIFYAYLSKKKKKTCLHLLTEQPWSRSKDDVLH